MSGEGRIVDSLNRLLEAPTKEAFEEINVYLSNVPIAKVAEVANQIHLEVYINKLLENFTNDDLLPDLSQMLTRLLQSLPPARVLSEFKEQLIYALQHPAPPVKLIGLRQVQQSVGSCSKELVEESELLAEVITQLGSSDLQVASLASNILLAIGSQDNKNLSVLCTPRTSDLFRNLLTVSDLVKFRVYELMVKLALESKTAMAEVSGFLESLVHEVDSQDPLSALNALELITQLTLSEHGAEFLGSLSVSHKLQNKILEESEDPAMQILMPSLLKYFGKLGHHNPQYLYNNFPKILDVIMKLIEDDKVDIGQKTAAIDCLSMVGTSMEGKQVLASLGPKFHPTLQALASIADTGSEDLKVEALIAVAHLLKLQPEEVKGSNAILNVLEEWYQVSHTNLAASVVRTCRVPFPELRCSALMVVDALATLPWGQRKLAGQPGFLEFLLNRSSENTKEGHELRYAIVSTIVNSTSFSNSFEPDMVERLEQYYKEGPFYARSQAAVAMEGAN